MQSNRLSTHEIVSRSQRLGNSESPLSAVGVEDLSTPGRSGSLVAVFGDLEPGSGLSGGGVGDLGHVDEDGAVVVATNGGLRAGSLAGLSVHLDGEGLAGCRSRLAF